MRGLLPKGGWAESSDEEMARMIVERGMGVPALFLLEAMGPLSLVASSAATVLSPVGSILFGSERWSGVPSFLGDRGRMRRMLSMVEDALEGRRPE